MAATSLYQDVLLDSVDCAHANGGSVVGKPWEHLKVVKWQQIYRVDWDATEELNKQYGKY